MRPSVFKIPEFSAGEINGNTRNELGFFLSQRIDRNLIDKNSNYIKINYKLIGIEKCIRIKDNLTGI